MKIQAAIVAVIAAASLNVSALEIGRGMNVSPMHDMIEIFVSAEREKYGDVKAECTLFDKYGDPIDTVKTNFTQNRMPLYFNGQYWRVESVSCKLARQAAL
ncbi:hypothetical protein GCM10023116_27680 [Kistimonas scapharcae]|uniref:Uncharacterized protein n=1 Tax=Kistimonas scapharcae TaxID=1036133 RepID=A0ABP8V5C7_9GAMM